MAITSGFFDSIDGDRVYNAEQMTRYFDGLVSDGVYESIGDRFLVSSANDGMKVTVGTGRAIIKSRWILNDEAATMTLDPSDSTKNRIDAIVLRLDLTSRNVVLTIKNGTAVSGTPAMPEPTRTATLYELYLAAVLISAGSTQPTRITALRPSSYCGWVTGVVQQVNTSDLFNQWNEAYSQMFSQFDAYMAEKEAAFNAWFQSLTQTLNVNTQITKYQRVKVLTSKILPSTFEFIEIDDYDASTDILFVYVNGVLFPEIGYYNGSTFVPEVDVTEQGIMNLPFGGYVYEDKATGCIWFNRTLEKNTAITFVVIKNVIGADVIAEAVSGNFTQNMGDTNIGGTIAFVPDEEV